MTGSIQLEPAHQQNTNHWSWQNKTKNKNENETLMTMSYRQLNVTLVAILGGIVP